MEELQLLISFLDKHPLIGTISLALFILLVISLRGVVKQNNDDRIRVNDKLDDVTNKIANLEQQLNNTTELDKMRYEQILGLLREIKQDIREVRNMFSRTTFGSL